MPVPKLGAAFSCEASSCTGPPIVSATASFCWVVQLGTCLAPSASLVASSADPALSLLAAPSSSFAMPPANSALPEASCWAPSRSWVSLFVSSWPLLPTWSRADPSGLPGVRSAEVIAIAAFCASVRRWRICGVNWCCRSWSWMPRRVFATARIRARGELINHR